jgi:hypothetical protein
MPTFDSNFSYLEDRIDSATSLEAILSTGSETGNNPIILSNSGTNPLAKVKGEDSSVADGGSLLLEGGESTFSAGGDVIITSGSGVSSDGLIRLVGDIILTGSISGTLVFSSGIGSPEGSVTAPVGSLYQRLNGGSGNALYVKISGVGNSGWAPAGPYVEQTFTGDGINNTFSLSRNFYRNPSLGLELQVYWNGMKLTRNSPENGFIAVGSNQVQISSIPFTDDIISVLYLPL